MENKNKNSLVVIATHPIQYQIPVWRGVADKLGEQRLVVYYLTRHGVAETLDEEFGVRFKWDSDLLSGYRKTFATGATAALKDLPIARYTWILETVSLVKRFQASHVLLCGWNVNAYIFLVIILRIIFPRKLKFILRCEATDRGRTPNTKSVIKSFLTRIFLRFFDNILYIGSDNLRFYLNRNVKRSKLIFGPYGVDHRRVERYRMNRDHVFRRSVRKALNIEDDSIVILFAGKFIEKKRPMDIIDSLHLLRAYAKRRIHLLFVGDGSERNLLLSRTTVQYAPASWDVTKSDEMATSWKPVASFTGFLNQQEILNSYYISDIFILPSDHRETWGLVVNEAMLFSLIPVVSRSCGCCSDLVSRLERRLVFDCGDVAGMARAIEFALEGNINSADILERVEKYTLDVTVKKISDLVDLHAG